MTNSNLPSSFAIWHGMERSNIDWHPTVDESKCMGCGLCVVTCGEKRNVFGFDLEKKKSVVMFPENCMVGCNNCGVACLWDAISFPGLSYVKDMVAKIPADQIQKEFQKKISDNPSLIVVSGNA